MTGILLKCIVEASRCVTQAGCALDGMHFKVHHADSLTPKHAVRMLKPYPKSCASESISFKMLNYKNESAS